MTFHYDDWPITTFSTAIVRRLGFQKFEMFHIRPSWILHLYTKFRENQTVHCRVAVNDVFQRCVPAF